MTNKFTSPPPDELIRAKLQVLLETANRIYQEGGVALKEDIIDAYNEAIGLFFDSFDNSILGVTYPIMPGMPADPIDYNVFSRAILYDLQVLFAEVGAIDRLISSNFNSIVALRDRLLSVSRRIASKTADYLLYADPSLGDGFFFGDSFNSAAYLDLGSKLVDGDECLLNQEEGVVLLPLDGSPERVRISKYTINDTSNGELGNNQQIGVEPHDSLQTLGDGEPDTWVEYERVVSSASSTPLRLDLTLVLYEPKIINHIHIVPVQFGTPSPVKITKLETSIDGKEYISIKDEIPISDFLSEDEDEIFELSGKTSKYSGEGYYSFLPRRAQYVHIVFEQYTPYAIETNNGTRLRYAIGLKDINVYSRKFKASGSIVSQKISVGGDATKVSMWASENPIDVSKLADIKHEISYNDGAVWVGIQPQGRNYSTYPEVLNFNNADDGSISTGGEINTIRHKISMTRNAEAFSGNITLKQEKLNTIDLVSVTGLSPFVLGLQNEPIAESVHVSIPVYGSFSCPRSRSNLTAQYLSPPMDLDFVETVLPSTTVESIRFKLPYKNVPDLSQRVRVFVDGAQWSYASTTSESLASLTVDSRVYFLNQGGRELQFVFIDDTGNKYGKIPGGGAKVQICLDGDNPPLIKTDSGYTLQFMGNSDGFKKYVGIVTALSLDTNVESVDDSGPFSVASLVEPIAPSESYNVPASQYSINLNAYLSQLTSEDSTQASTDIGGDGSEETSSDTSWGSIPPIYNSDPNTFRMEEYLPENPAILMPATHTLRSYHNLTDPTARSDGYVPFVDGDSEFYSGEVRVRTRWTFDPYTGILYFGMSHRGNHSILFKYSRRKFKVLSQSDWDYYKDPATGRADTSRIVLKPSAVYQFEVVKEVDTGFTSMELVQQNLPRHDWWTQKLVKGSLKLSDGIIKNSSGLSISPIEVKYVDGYTELQNSVSTSQMILAEAGGLHSFYLAQIDATHQLRGSLTFDPVIEYPQPITPSQFTTQVTTEAEVTEAGKWWVDTDATSSTYGKVVIATGATTDLRTHTVKYQFEDTTNGIDKSSLYSVDYSRGVIYFSTPLSEGGTITFNVTIYSAFYNFSEVVGSENIKSIEEKEKKIELDVNYAEKFLKDSSPQNPRPRFVKVGYEYYKKSNESLKDLEPYFSPICKDIALRAITKDQLGSL